MPKIQSATVQFNASNCMFVLAAKVPPMVSHLIALHCHSWSVCSSRWSFRSLRFNSCSKGGEQQREEEKHEANERHKIPDRIYQILGPLFRTRPRSQWTDLKSKRKQQEKGQCKELCSRGCVHYNFPQIYPFDLINCFEVQRKKIRNQQSSLSH